jgi:hypothetical protein
MENHTGNIVYLHETIKGLIVWINNQESIPDFEKESKIKELIEDLKETGCTISSVKCMGSWTKGMHYTLMNLFVTADGMGTWTCPMCGSAKKAVKIQGFWFEDQE